MTAARPPEGRPVPRVVVKRNNPRLIDVYGHWWVEIDGVESYGWWPATRPVSIPKALRGVPGVLNGMGGPGGGSPTVDPRHGELADHAFHPVTCGGRTDDEIVASVRSFATSFAGGWRWSTRPAVNCRSFQADLLAAAGLVVPDGYGHTAGAGCPFLAPPRRWRRQLARRRPQPGRGRRTVKSPQGSMTEMQHGANRATMPATTAVRTVVPNSTWLKRSVPSPTGATRRWRR